ncbi:hypothetical protein IH799_06200, partial [candidate division KSB1 bacterium]|nr:hypothetical protein [candidate division KSB1 bacterium]
GWTIPLSGASDETASRTVDRRGVVTHPTSHRAWHKAPHNARRRRPKHGARPHHRARQGQGGVGACPRPRPGARVPGDQRHAELRAHERRTPDAFRRAGAAAIDLAYVACGRLDGFWELMLNSWDIAAGALLIEEAGGEVTDIWRGDSHLKTGHIVASNGLIHEKITTATSNKFSSLINE